MRHTVCHQQVPGFSPIFNHWPARHCYFRPLRGSQRYKQAYVKKVIKPANRRARTRYGQEHQHKTIDDFWQYIFFTDEAHIDPSSCAQGSILREQGHRIDPQNI
jgi:hypothetical protein